VCLREFTFARRRATARRTRTCARKRYFKK
jgi:hypothetical protein